MNIIDSLEWRYATKKFDESIILFDDVINRLAKAFNLTATSYGLQPIKLKIIKNKALQEKMSRASFDQEQVATASHVLVFCVEKNIDANFINSYFEIVKSVRKKDLEDIDKYNQILIDRFSKQSPEQIFIWSVKQAYIALGNMLTVCAVEQIDSCPMEGFIPNQIDTLISLEKENLTSVLLLPIGIRDKEDQSANYKKVRHPIKNIVEFIS